MNRIHLWRSQTLVRARQNEQFLLYATKHRETLPAGTAENSMSHQKMFVSTVFKTVFHLIFNAKIMSILEITFGISFISNDLGLTDILSKTENALSTAIYQSEVRQLEKNIKFTIRQFASTCLSVKTPQTTKSPQTNTKTSLSSFKHHHVPKHTTPNTSAPDMGQNTTLWYLSHIRKSFI